MRPVQLHRQIAITTALGPDALVLNRVSIRERLSAPFEIEAELSSLDPNINHDAVMGHPATLRLDLEGGAKRFFSGIVSRFRQTGSHGGHARYQATIVPWLWFLTRTSDCRVFQRKTVLNIVQEVFEGHRFGSEYFEIRTQGSFPQRRYCVQYRETDFNFINRLLESEGIYYWFEHQDGKHRMILANSLKGNKPTKGYETLEYKAIDDASAPGNQVISDWVVEKEVQPVNYELKDFDFKKPSHPLKVNHEQNRDHGMARFGVYDYPGEYYEEKDGKRQAQLRLEELQARYEVVHGGSVQARGLAAGHTFTLKAHPRTDQNRQYLITSSMLTLDTGEYASGGTGEEFLRCEFQAIPAKTPYRAPRATPKPLIQGIQTATVVGQKGKEVDPDDHGRVKVQFHWDRYGKMDENSSCWVRVSQPWAGKGYGGMNIPRIGQEVVVEFIEGDPDRPLINGRLYNEESMPHPSNAGRDGKPGNVKPSGIAQAAMMTSFKSNSLGGSGGSNEITMNDEGGKEGLMFKAQKDEIHNVGNDREDSVAHDETRKVGNDRSREVGNNETIKVAMNREKTIGADEKETIGANKTIDVTSNHTEKIGKNMSITIGMMKNESVGIASTENVGAAKTLTVGAAYAVTVGGAMNTAVGLTQMEEVGLTKKIFVGTSFEITCGSSSLKMDSGGKITLEGTDIVIKSSGPAKVSADAALDLHGSVIDLNK